MAATDLTHDLLSHPFAVHFIGLKARQLCRRWDVSRSDRDDLKQEMRLHLWKKADGFDPGRGTVEAFVTSVLNSWAAMYLRRLRRRSPRRRQSIRSLQRTCIDHEGTVSSLASVLTPEDGDRRRAMATQTPLELIDVRDGIAHVLARLEPERRRILALVAEHGVAATAESLRVSRRYVCSVVSRMRVEFEDAGFIADSCTTRRERA